jgi:hypothetical protein
MIFGVAITDSRLVAAPTGIDSLWQKAADIAAKNWNLVPGYTIRIDRMLDRNGKVSSVTEVWIKHTLTDSLTIENTIVKALVDSQEVPEAKYDQFRQFTHQDIRPDNKSLFHNTPPDNPLITRTNEQREIDKRLCIGYKYEYRVEDDEHGSISQSGMAWIDKATGTPIYLEFVADNLPRVVKSMDGCAVYSFDPTNEKWWLEKTVTNMEIRMFFVTRKMQSEIRYKDYWEYPGVK